MKRSIIVFSDNIQGAEILGFLHLIYPDNVLTVRCASKGRPRMLSLAPVICANLETITGDITKFTSDPVAPEVETLGALASTADIHTAVAAAVATPTND